MTRKEQIEQESAINACYVGGFGIGGRITEDKLRTYQNGFIRGAEWADANPKSPWLNAKVDLPHKHDSLLIKCLPYNSKLTKPVLALVDDGSYQVCDMFINEEGKWEWSYNGTVICWFSIPEPPKE